MKLSASLMCADPLHLARDIDLLAQAGVEYLHFDIMDGHFVPNLMLPLDLVGQVGAYSALPRDIHLMCERPEIWVERLALRAGDIVTLHVESTPHIHRAIMAVRRQGAAAGIALNPGTPLEALRECTGLIDVVLLMSVDPGYAGQAMAPGALDKIRRMRENLDALGLEHIAIEVDGNCSFENAPRMSRAGADILVVGSSSLFHPGASIEENARRLRDSFI